MDVGYKSPSNKEEPEKDVWNAKELIERKKNQPKNKTKKKN